MEESKKKLTLQSLTKRSKPSKGGISESEDNRAEDACPPSGSTTPTGGMPSLFFRGSPSINALRSRKISSKSLGPGHPPPSPKGKQTGDLVNVNIATMDSRGRMSYLYANPDMIACKQRPDEEIVPEVYQLPASEVMMILRDVLKKNKKEGTEVVANNARNITWCDDLSMLTANLVPIENNCTIMIYTRSVYHSQNYLKKLTLKWVEKLDRQYVIARSIRDAQKSSEINEAFSRRSSTCGSVSSDRHSETDMEIHEIFLMEQQLQELNLNSSIAKLKSRSDIASYLIAPVNFTSCVPGPDAQFPVPLYMYSATKVATTFYTLVKKDKDLDLIAFEKATNLMTLSVKNCVITAEFISLNDATANVNRDEKNSEESKNAMSTIAMYSRSVYCTMSLQKQLVVNWLTMLPEVLDKLVPSPEELSNERSISGLTLEPIARIVTDMQQKVSMNSSYDKVNIDIKHLTSRPKRGTYLYAPPNFTPCKPPADPDLLPRNYDCNARKLASIIKGVLKKDNLALVSGDSEESTCFTFCEDLSVITVQCVNVKPELCTVAVYARSIYHAAKYERKIVLRLINKFDNLVPAKFEVGAMIITPTIIE